jgi:hypothetical protein
VTSLPGLERLVFVLVILGKQEEGRRLNPRPNPSIFTQHIIKTLLCQEVIPFFIFSHEGY